MDGKMLARLGTVVFVAIAITATAIEMTREEETSADPTAAVIAPAAPDPLREGQRRCQRLGEAGTRDAECLRVWAESRDRFLGLDRQRPSVPSNDDPATKQTAPAEPSTTEER